LFSGNAISRARARNVEVSEVKLPPITCIAAGKFKYCLVESHYVCQFQHLSC